MMDLSPRRGLALIAGALLAVACGGGAGPAPAEPGAGDAAGSGSPSLILITLDTTRADRLGAYGAASGLTPHLDALAARGTRWQRAIAAAPLTLPSHATLLTGLDPPAHGLRENGTAALPADLPTLATVLAAAGYDTAAFVSSRVLDSRFGLDRGFAVYDDRIAAERMGEYGYPERGARRVTEAALRWLADRSPADPPRPFFLWVHYYDPHSPYDPPGSDPHRPPAERYAAEIAYVDRWVGRLLERVPTTALVAAVGDHGEMLGEHGEPTHGLFLYRSSLRVPLIVAGPGVEAGRVEPGPVAIRDLAGSLLRWLEVPPAGIPGRLPAGGRAGEGERPVYSETWLPAAAYGWSPLVAITEGGWRLVVAPRPELYEVLRDRGESDNRLVAAPEIARRLERRLDRYLATLPPPRPAAPGRDEELAAELASLGYLTGSAAVDARPGRGLDPKDGLPLLARFEAAQRRLSSGDATGAAAALGKLVAESPGNLPFTTLWGRALFSAGRVDEAIAAFRRAAEIAPALDLVHVNLADAYLAAGRSAEARREFRLAAELNPGSARAWGRLAQIELAAGEPLAARRLLAEGLAAGAASASLLTRLAELERAAGEPARAEARLVAAVELEPEWFPAWLALGRLRAVRGDLGGARAALRKAATPETPTAAEAARELTALERLPADASRAPLPPG